MRIVNVQIGARAYPIFIGPSVSAHLAEFHRSGRTSPRFAIVADETVAELHLAGLQAHLPAEPLVSRFPPGEASKSILTASRIYDQLAQARIERGDILIAFGGGVAGDLGGFVAATWHRGIRFIQVPTTLEAAVDASVGGKTGVNHAAGKNLIGAFHQPIAVIVDTEFLATLPPRDYAAGLAESVKHAAIADPAFLDWHESNAAAILNRDPTAVSELIARNCEIKAGVVGRDEREENIRIYLNHGHTIAHAIEHLLGYDLRHGECVALGILVENEIACQRGDLDRSTADRIRSVLETFGLPMFLPRSLDAGEIAAACRRDKKVRAGAVQFVLIQRLGDPLVVSDVADNLIQSSLRIIQPAT